MSLTTIINLVLIGVIVICAWQGFKKGIIMGIIGVLVIILSLYGAKLLTETFSREVVPMLKPFVSGVMDTRVEETGYEVLGYEPDEEGSYNVTLSLTDLLERQPEARREICRWVYRDLGIYESVADDMAEQALDYAEQKNESITAACTMILCQSAAYYLGFLLAFILIFSALTVVVNIPNLSFRIPYVGIINDLVGLAIGVYTGMLLCAVLVWTLQFTGLVLPEDAIAGSRLAVYFLEKNMLAQFITL